MERDGQMTLEDWYMENFSLGAQLRKEGYTNAYDAMPDHDCEVDVVDHNGNRFRTMAVINKFGNKCFQGPDKGYGICWWREVEKPLPVLVKGMCDDAYCPKCGLALDEFQSCDQPCPECHTKLDWAPWHRVNDDWWLKRQTIRGWK